MSKYKLHLGMKEVLPALCFKGHRKSGIEFWGPLVYWISIILCPKKQYLLCTDSLVSVDADQGSLCFKGGNHFLTAKLVSETPWLDDTDHDLEY